MSPTRRRMAGARRAGYRRARTLGGTLGLTALGTLVPGSSVLFTGRRLLGAVLLTGTAALLALAGYGLTHRSMVLNVAVDMDKLLVTTVAASALVVVLVGIAVLTYLLVRRRRAPRRDRWIEIPFLVLMCAVVAAPFAVGARYSTVQRDLVGTVFPERRIVVDGVQGEGEEFTLGGDDHRVNVLLLGGDGGVHRVGIRTDTVILASIDTETGDTVLFSLPRNLQDVPFPTGTKLHRLYPRGFDGPGDSLEWMLNAVYSNVPRLHPHLLDGSSNEGARAVKMAVSGALGIPVDYYVLVNLRGFQQVVEAMGGITVNINQPIPIGGSTGGNPPRDYLEPGPSKHLNGFEALWFARGRYGLDDYDRMERQRCVIDAIIDEAKPMTLLRRYEALASAGKKVVRTDIPQDLVPEFVELASRVRHGDFRSVVFQMSDRFNPNDPDYQWLHRKVEQTMAAAESENSGEASASPAPTATPSSPPASAAPEASGAPRSGQPTDPCAYHPVG